MVEKLYSQILVLGKEADGYNSLKRGMFTLKAELLLKASSGYNHIQEGCESKSTGFNGK